MLRAVVVSLLAVLVSALLVPVSGPAASREPDPRWRFYSSDRTAYASPWYVGRHRIMIPFGCTRAPYYSPDSRCSRNRGFHHGLDIAIPCGRKLRAGRPGWVVDNSALGPAYGRNPLLIRNHRLGVDILIAHTRRVFVQRGDRVRRGDVIARVSDDGAPDGCHLHFEVRDARGGLSTAVAPRRLLGLRR
ncbi:M23 family metallopeptidase [Nocardioides pacificus]